MSFNSTTRVISQYNPGELVHIITEEEIAYTLKKKKKETARFPYSILAEPREHTQEWILRVSQRSSLAILAPNFYL